MEVLNHFEQTSGRDEGAQSLEQGQLSNTLAYNVRKTNYNSRSFILTEAKPPLYGAIFSFFNPQTIQEKR